VTGLVVAPHGISPITGWPRLTPPTIGSIVNQSVPKRKRSAVMSAYQNALTRTLTEIVEQKFAALQFDPWATLVAIASNPDTDDTDRIQAIRAMLPFLYPRKKSVEVTTKKDVVHRYVIEVPAPPSDATPILELKKDG
jgi:hypothetical protein